MKVLDSNELEQLSGYLENSRRIAILVHIHPDGDAIGCGSGMQRYLRGLGKEVCLLCPTPVPETLDFVRNDSDGAMLIASENPDLARQTIAEADLILGQDFNNLDRIEGMEEAFKEASAPKVLIDHHVDPEREYFDLTISYPNVSSASELVFWLLLELNGGDISKLPQSTLEALMVGMTTDTNNFSNSTTPETLEMASLCIANGVDRNAILAEIYQQYRKERILFQGYFLSRKLRFTEKGAAYAVFSKEELAEFDIQEGDTEGFVNIPLGIKTVRLSLFLKEQEGQYRVSVRSKKGTSARECCKRHFNGGGHENAAGGKLPVSEFPDLASVEAYIEKVSDEFLTR